MKPGQTQKSKNIFLEITTYWGITYESVLFIYGSVISGRSVHARERTG